MASQVFTSANADGDFIPSTVFADAETSLSEAESVSWHDIFATWDDNHVELAMKVYRHSMYTDLGYARPTTNSECSESRQLMKWKQYDKILANSTRKNKTA